VLYLPKFTLSALCKYYILKGERRLSNFAWNIRPKSLPEFFGGVRQKEVIRNRFTQVWNEKKIDVLIMPVFPLPAVRAEDGENLLQFLTFNLPASAFDMPAGTVPIRCVKPEEEVFASRYKDSTADIYTNSIKGSSGLPIGIQVVSMSFEDEMCLAAMKHIEDIFKFHKMADIANP